MKGKYYWKFQSIIQEILSEQDKCIICGGKKNLSVHHIVHASSDEKLYADKNNIVIMCRDCHLYYHNHYPNNCGLTSLIEFVKDYGEMETQSLRDEIDELRKERTEYLDLINYLTQMQ